MGIDDQIRSVENRLTSLETERTGLLTELKNLRSQRDEHKPVALLGRPTLMKAPESNEDKADLFLAYFEDEKTFIQSVGRTTKPTEVGMPPYVKMSG